MRLKGFGLWGPLILGFFAPTLWIFFKDQVSFLSHFLENLTGFPALDQFLRLFFMVGIPEEFLKGTLLLFFLKVHPIEFPKWEYFFLLPFLIGQGFATGENYYYLSSQISPSTQSGITLIAQRIFFCNGAHILLLYFFGFHLFLAGKGITQKWDGRFWLRAFFTTLLVGFFHSHFDLITHYGTGGWGFAHLSLFLIFLGLILREIFPQLPVNNVNIVSLELEKD